MDDREVLDDSVEFAELSDADLAAIDEAEPYSAGKAMPIEDAFEYARKKTREWLKHNPKDLAA